MINNKNALFSQSAGLKRKRHLFPMPFNVKTTFNAGKLVPLVVQEVLPGGEWKINLSEVVRGLTPMYPVMDDSFLDIYAFWVPNRQVWDHWEAFRTGAHSATPGTPADYSPGTEYSVPQIRFDHSMSDSITCEQAFVGSFWDYAGVGFAKGSQPVTSLPPLSALPPRGYVKIWNEWFRDENYQQPALLYTDDSNRGFSTPVINSTFGYDINTPYLGQSLLPVNKYHDYFTSSLPQAQKGDPTLLPIVGSAPVVGNIPSNSFSVGNMGTDARALDNLFSPQWLVRDGDNLSSVGGPILSVPTGRTELREVAGSSTDVAYLALGNNPINYDLDNTPLSADLSQATAISVNAQRLAFQVQRFKEQLARTGSRYVEYLQGVFGVYAANKTLQRTEFLGGKRIPITQHQVAASFGGGEQDIELGSTGAFSFTASSRKKILHFTAEEDGYFFILACVRTSQTYSQGIPKQFRRFDKFDFYNPVFAHLSEQPILREEIYNDNETNGQLVFGYKEAWSEYRYRQNLCTAYMRPQVNGSLAQWHYGSVFANSFSNNSKFLIQGVEEVDRSLAVGSRVSDQFFGDFFFNAKVWNVMPIRSNPGLIDHDYH